jgi:quinol monooxygenase YgiN
MFYNTSPDVLNNWLWANTTIINSCRNIFADRKSALHVLITATLFINKSEWSRLYGIVVVQILVSISLKTLKEVTMTNVGLLVRLEAKKGKEMEVEKFLRSGLPIVEREPATATWYAIRFGPSSFGIFDTFPDNQGREAHLSGQIAKALKERSSELFSQPPVIEKLDVLEAKLQEMAHH